MKFNMFNHFSEEYERPLSSTGVAGDYFRDQWNCRQSVQTVTNTRCLVNFRLVRKTMRAGGGVGKKAGVEGGGGK